MSLPQRSRIRRLLVPGAVMILFWTLAVVGWLASGFLQPLFLFGYIGLALGVGLGLYAVLPRAKKPLGRRLALVLIGGGLFFFMGLLQSENMQIEWVFFSVLAGLFGAALTHYLIAKLIGPLFFGRLWCGWACWTAMLLDLLPFRRSPGRVPGRWGHLRYLHFGLSLGLVLLLWYGFAYREPIAYNSPVGLVWMLAGNALYYLVGVGLALALRDNRAFCKYVCPITLFLKAGSRLSLLKVAGDAEACTGCNSCSRACPMDIRVSDYVRSGRRVLSTECTLCQTCITVCPGELLKLSVGLDRGGVELLRVRAARGAEAVPRGGTRSS